LPSSGVPHRSDDPKTCDSSGDTAKVNVEKLDKKLKKMENKLAATRYPQKKKQSSRP
jgi:transcriptional accessory protein Tex/SPT6